MTEVLPRRHDVDGTTVADRQCMTSMRRWRWCLYWHVGSVVLVREQRQQSRQREKKWAIKNDGQHFIPWNVKNHTATTMRTPLAGRLYSCTRPEDEKQCQQLIAQWYSPSPCAQQASANGIMVWCCGWSRRKKMRGRGAMLMVAFALLCRAFAKKQNKSCVSLSVVRVRIKISAWPK